MICSHCLNRAHRTWEFYDGKQNVTLLLCDSCIDDEMSKVKPKPDQKFWIVGHGTLKVDVNKLHGRNR